MTAMRMLRGLPGLALGLWCGVAVAADPQGGYAHYKATSYLPFLTAPAAGAGIAVLPHLRLSFGGAIRDAVMDTGSTSVVVSADAIPNLAKLPSRGAARLTYSSSGRIMEGRWVVTRMTIAGADGSSITTTPIPVIAVTQIECVPNARNCTPERLPTGVAEIGVGFGREYDGQAQSTPDKNPFLHPAVPHGQALRRGYVITGAGVHVGLTAGDAAGRFVFAKLTRDTQRPDWLQAPTCISVGVMAPACGRLLVDTGVAGMFLTVPADRLTNGSLPVGSKVAIQLVAAGELPAVGYSFTVGDTSDPVAPGSVTLSGIGTRATFVNTSFHLLNGFDYLYDADGGWVGFRATR